VRRLLSSILLLVLWAAPAAAELKETSEPASLHKEFPKQAKLRVVNLWAMWCLPCVKELPDLAAIDGEFDDRQVQLLGVSLDDALPGDRAEVKLQVQEFLKKRGVKYPNIYYTGGIPKIQDHFRFSGEIPLTVVYDSAGRELSRHQGPVTRDAFSRELRQLLKKQGGS
jgi:thiol-disulfide isomerase/thioredoxin